MNKHRKESPHCYCLNMQPTKKHLTKRNEKQVASTLILSCGILAYSPLISICHGILRKPICYNLQRKKECDEKEIHASLANRNREIVDMH